MQLPSRSFPVEDNGWKVFMFMLLLISLGTWISLFELTDKGAIYWENKSIPTYMENNNRMKNIVDSLCLGVNVNHWSILAAF